MNILQRIKNKINALLFMRKIADNVIVEKGAVVDSNCIFEGGNRIASGTQMFNSKLGEGSYVGRDSKLFDTVIGKYSCIGPRVIVVRGEHPLEFVTMHPAFYSLNKQSGYTFAKKQMYQEVRYADAEKKISVRIGNDVWIASDCKLIEGITISDGAAVLAGAVVTKDVPPYAVVGGVPAKVIKYRFTEEQISILLGSEWWNWDKSKLAQNADLFVDIERFTEYIKSGD